MGFFIRRFSSTSVSSVFPSYCLRVLYLSLFFPPLLSSCLYARRGVPTH